jgi:hypothetical protein
MGSSPQLPFAFTPSMGGSLLSMADAHRQLLSAAAAAAGAGGGLLSSSRAALPAPAVARTGSGSASAAAAAAAGSSASSADAGGAAAAAGGGAAAAFGSIGSSTQAAALGTPSPPLHAPQLQPSAAHAADAAAAGVSGGHVSFIRDITGLATIRRPSWSSRSSSFDIAAASLPHHLSMSPGMDLLDPGLMMGYGSSLGSGAPGSRQPAMQAAATAGAAAAPAVVYRWNLGQVGAAEAGASAQQQQQVLGGDGSGDAAQPMAAHEAAGGSSSHAEGSGSGPALGVSPACAAAGGDSAACVGSSSGPYEAYGSSGAGHDDSESDLLPFVLDSEPPLLPQQQQHGGSSAPAVSRIGQQAAAAAAAAAAATPGGGAGEHDIAVGAFLKLVQEAGGAPVGRLDRRQALWQQQAEAAVQRGSGGDLNAEVDALKGPPPACVGDAALQVQQLAAQLRVLLFPE